MGLSEKTPAMELMALLEQYSALVSAQLIRARDLLAESVSNITDDAISINTAVENSKAAAEQALEEVFVSPDEQTRSVVDALQARAGDLFEKMQAAMESNAEGTFNGVVSAAEEIIPSQSDAALTEWARTASNRFTSHMDQFSSTEQFVEKTLLKMTGTLSSDDVIAHYMRHAAASLGVFEDGLSTILLNFEKSCTSENIQKLRADLYDFNDHQYSSEAERQTLAAFFKRNG